MTFFIEKYQSLLQKRSVVDVDNQKSYPNMVSCLKRMWNLSDNEKLIVKSFIWFTMIIILNVTYFKSLKGCDFTGDLIEQWAEAMKDEIPIWAGEVAVTALCLVILLLSSKYTAVLAIINFLILFFYQGGVDVKSKYRILVDFGNCFLWISIWLVLKTCRQIINLFWTIDHGGLNRLLNVIWITTFIALYYSIIGMVQLYKRFKTVFL